MGWKMTPAINKAGGLLCLWSKAKLEVTDHFQGSGYLGLEGTWKEKGIQILIVNIYAPCEFSQKRQLWGQLKEKRERSNIKWWCLMGDFNSVRKVTERVGVNGGNVGAVEIGDFNNFISDLGIVEVPLIGRSFTWYRPNGRAKSRIDRIFVSRDWFDQWPGSIQMVLDRNISDHCPILLKNVEVDWGPKPFRFLDCWLHDKDFRPLVEKTWEETNVHGWGAFVVKEKLKQLKITLRDWHARKSDDLETQHKVISNKMNDLDKKEESSELTMEEILLKRELQEKFWEVATRNESILAQKSRVSWWMDDPKQVKLQVKKFFHNRFMEQHWERPLIEGVQFKQISDREKCQLTADIDLEEIKMAVWDCDSSKSPGPDGFNFKFIKSFWETVKEDIVRMMKEFHANGKLPKGTNSTFITLIPKVDDPQSLGDYRPISLVGCLYKILAKILANRLKKVLPSVIDDRQSAFLEGRNLLQSVVIANETLDEVKKEKKSCIFFKVDYEKAYDSVNWEFLLYMLRRLGFDPKWIQWIRACLESAHVSYTWTTEI
uniref:Transposon TX1 uncharacterized n=1 Tax=Cajanus cajan TaxID=3821 RepID=A0A151TI35_CAJCA|nr:Transposon TX1 uncharacterized [Cajanus cajan]